MSEPPTLALTIRVTRDGKTLVGPGRADLLMHIAATGSIAAAGRRMAMSYKRAWSLVETMNASFPLPLVEAAKGGAGGGGAKLTATGEAVLAAYRALQAQAEAAAQTTLGIVAAALSVPP